MSKDNSDNGNIKSNKKVVDQKSSSKKVKRKKTPGDIIRIFIMLIAVGVFIYSASQLALIFLEYKAGTDEYQGLRKYVSVNDADGGADGTNVNEEEMAPAADAGFADRTIDFTALKGLNPDIIGWIVVDGVSQIDYPIVKGQDNERYLHYTFQGNYNNAGSIFMDYTNNENFTDSNTFIYGHNMKNGSMFGNLKAFHKKETYESSPYIWIYTPDKDYKYQIFSYYVANVEGDSFIKFYDTPEEFDSYLAMIKGYSEYNTGIDVSGEDKIITLSTCTGNDATRFLVHAKMIAARDSNGHQEIFE